MFRVFVVIPIFFSLSIFSLDFSKQSFYEFGKSEIKFSRLKVLAVGDFLIYDNNYNHFKEGGSCADFYEMVEPIKNSLEKADLSIINLEVTAGGEDFGYHGYPKFNAPFSLADALYKVGFNFFATANNHSYDYGEKAIKTSTNHYKKMGYQWNGTSADSEEYNKISYFEKDGIKVAILSFTDISNIYVQEDRILNILYKKNMVAVFDKLTRARESSDILIIILHYGDEYINFPNKRQRELVNFFADNGADIIFGGHSHTLQPVDFIKNNKGEKVYVVYSMGNFLSWMSNNNLEKCVGGIFKIDIVKEKSQIFNYEKIYLENPCVELTYTLNYQKIHKTLYFRDSKEYIKNFEEKYINFKNHIKSFYSDIEVY